MTTTPTFYGLCAGMDLGIGHRGSPCQYCGHVSRVEIPKLDITCDHRGGAYEYHCEVCCPGASIGPDGNMGPCHGHIEGSALAVLERRRIWIGDVSAQDGRDRDRHRFPMAVWLLSSDIDRAIDGDPKIVDVGCARPEGSYLPVDLAERFALDILAAVGAARRGER